MIFAFTNGLLLDGIATEWPAAEGAVAPPDRAAIFGGHLENVLITSFQGRASLRAVRAIRIENSKEIKQ